MLILSPIFFLVVSAVQGDRTTRPHPYVRRWRETIYKDDWRIKTTETYTPRIVLGLVLESTSLQTKPPYYISPLALELDVYSLAHHLRTV